MKKLAYILAISLLCFNPSSVFAKPLEVMHTSQGQADEKAEVEKAFADWRQALSSGKSENVVKLYDPSAILLATLAEKPITDQKERTDYFDKLTAKPKLMATVNEDHIRLLDENSAVVSGLYTFSFEENGNKVSIPARYTFVYEKENGRWMIVEHHSSKVPQQN